VSVSLCDLWSDWPRSTTLYEEKLSTMGGGGGQGVVGGVLHDIGISGFLSKNVGMFLASYPYLHIDTQH